jgi:hypothetical protein
MTRLRRATVLAVALTTLVSPATALADDTVRNGDTVTDAAVTDRHGQDRGFEFAKERALAAIAARLRALEGLSAKIAASRFITEQHAGMLRGDIVRSEAGLEHLARQIEAASSMEELRPLVLQIDDFKVFQVLVPKTHQVIASDTLVVVAGKLDRFAGKLGEVIERFETAGFDVTEAQRLLGDMNDLIDAGHRLASPVAGSVIGLGPEDWPEPAQGLLAAGRADLHEARATLRDAYGTGKEIVEFLRSLIDSLEAAGA